MACASATDCSRVPSRMKYQASASGQGARAVQGGAEAGQQGPVAQADVGQLGAGGADGGQRAGVTARRRRPARPGPAGPGTSAPSAGRSAGGGDGEGEDGLGDVGVVGGVPAAGLDHLEQRHGQVARRQAPQRHGGLVGPDGDPARAGGVQQAAGAGGFGAGVGAAFAVQHEQQRTRPAVVQVGGAGGGVPAGPGPHHQVRLPAAGRADHHLMPAHRRVRARSAPGASGGRPRGWSRPSRSAPCPSVSGTVPGAVIRARAVRACRRHCRASNTTGAVAVLPERPVSMA